MVIEILIGNIACGKSTYCHKRAQLGWVVVNDDAVVNAVHGGDYTLYNKSLKPLYKSIEDHILHTAIAMGKSVCIDRGVDLRKTSRARWISIAKSLEVPVRAVVFEMFPPEVHARRRTDFDARGLDYDFWLEAAVDMAKEYTPPTLEEGFIEIDYVKWNSAT